MVPVVELRPLMQRRGGPVLFDKKKSSADWWVPPGWDSEQRTHVAVAVRVAGTERACELAAGRGRRCSWAWRRVGAVGFHGGSVSFPN